jgi:DNA-binding LacI/PurR family transcriptional regulator
MATDISLKCELYRGLHTRIAKRLGLSRSFVWRVANGERISPKVEAAIEKELARIQRQAAKVFRQPNSRS